MSRANNPFVSVVMPVFNHPPYRLRRAIQSILDQTYSCFELIVADGSLTDVNLKVVEEFNDPRIVYCKAKGYINCLNLGLKKANGVYIARMDSDDVSLPQRLEEQVRFLEQNPHVGLCSCQAELFGDIAPHVTKYPAEVDFISYVKRGEIIHPAIMFRRTLNIEYEHIKPYEDCLLFRILLLNGCVIKNVDKVLFKSRVNRNSIMARHPKLMTRYLSKINLEAFSRLPQFKGILSFSPWKKRRFSISDFSGFFAFVGKMKKWDALYGTDALSMFRPFLDYMISHAANKRMIYFKLLTSPVFYELASPVFYETYRPVRNIVRQIFSIHNKRLSDGRKIKVATVLGRDIKLGRR